MRGLGRLLVFLGALPGAAVTVWALVSAYRAIGAGGEVDESQLRGGVELGLKLTGMGLPVVALGVVVWVIGAMRGPKVRRDQRSK